MKTNKYIIILIFCFVNIIFANTLKVVVGEANLTSSDAKRFKRYGNDPSRYKELSEVWPSAERNAAQNALLKGGKR